MHPYRTLTLRKHSFMRYDLRNFLCKKRTPDFADVLFVPPGDLLSRAASLKVYQHCRGALKSYLVMRYIRRKIFVFVVRKGEVMW